MMESSLVKQVALLRGINNAGKGARVAMADLRALFERLGYRDVRTVRNSGNVVFSAPPGRRGNVVAQIEKALASKLRVTSRVTVLTADEVAGVVRENPFTRVATNPSHLLVVVPLVPSGLVRLRSLLKERWTPEAFALGSRVAYLWCARGVAKSPLWAAVERALERSGTARNIATMTKLLSAVEVASGHQLVN
jgi:uncharacterized protein (DUF1697 family)